MPDVGRLFQAFVAPAIFVSAAALLVLSLNVRLMGMVSRLRQFQHERHDAAQAQRLTEAQALDDQIGSVERRAEMIRRSILLVLISLVATILSCLLLGFGLTWKIAEPIAAVVFVAGILCMLAGTIYYVAEITVALSSVREEANYYQFADRRRSTEYRPPQMERRQDWQRPH